MNITMMREEIKSLLGISNDKMKYLVKRNKLNYELEVAGYKLITSYKDGRNTMYELEPIEIDEWAFIQSKYNIRNKLEHTSYSYARLNGGLDKNRSCILKEMKLTMGETSARRYDEILIKNNAIAKQQQENNGLNTATNVVYRMKDRNEEVIYVGKSEDFKTRIVSHSNEEKVNDWFKCEVETIDYVSFDEYGDCSLAEIYLITKLKPKYNIDFMKWNTSIIIGEFETLDWIQSGYIKDDSANTYVPSLNYEKYMDIVRNKLENIK